MIVIKKINGGFMVDIKGKSKELEGKIKGKTEEEKGKIKGKSSKLKGKLKK